MLQKDPPVGILQVTIILLVLATALIHLQRGIEFGMLMFIANAIGYVVLVAALYAPIQMLAPYRKWIRWLLVAFTLVTIIGWIAIGERILIGYIDKAIEIALVILLFIDARQASKNASQAA